MDRRPIRSTVQRVPGDHFTLGEPAILDLGRDTDVVLMRQDPPFDLGYITATHLLERIQGETLVVNDPGQRPQRARKGVGARLSRASCRRPWSPARSASPASSSPSMARSSSSRSTAMAARRSSRSAATAPTSSSLIEVFNTAYREPHMVQAFLPDVAKGDKRIVLVDGEVAGAVNRIPGEGEIRSNLAVGGKAAEDRADRARAGDLRRARPGAEARAGCCSSAST